MFRLVHYHKLHGKKHFNTILPVRGTLLKNEFSKGVFTGVKFGDSVTVTKSHI